MHADGLFFGMIITKRQVPNFHVFVFLHAYYNVAETTTRMIKISGKRKFVRHGHLSEILYEKLLTFVRHGHLSDIDNCSTWTFVRHGHLSETLSTKLHIMTSL